ncbi:hypothetical protein Lfu02_51510 [Longispora fulva]|uniref:DUF4333 domain-containing protein n=1 Tax=Longispora fulva TaxID=619741 RepID=A0A8J7KK54_9ACTN|nr:hypothetical protein [Longispora fulva]MBG6140955.1 hypothetical protein [Longispora fulva]GIG60779.1 hypothetical protein Lfu02_51510 [Longispora fulva]
MTGQGRGARRGPVGAAAGVVLLLLAGCSDPATTIAEGSYRNAVALGAGRVLAAQGVPLSHRLACATSGPDDWSTVRTVCTGRTTDGRPVRVDGLAERADTATPAERYTISVAGTVLVVTNGL